MLLYRWWLSLMVCSFSFVGSEAYHDVSHLLLLNLSGSETENKMQSNARLIRLLSLYLGNKIFVGRNTKPADEQAGFDINWLL